MREKEKEGGKRIILLAKQGNSPARILMPVVCMAGRISLVKMQACTVHANRAQQGVGVVHHAEHSIVHSKHCVVFTPHASIASIATIASITSISPHRSVQCCASGTTLIRTHFDTRGGWLQRWIYVPCGYCSTTTDVPIQVCLPGGSPAAEAASDVMYSLQKQWHH